MKKIVWFLLICLFSYVEVLGQHAGPPPPPGGLTINITEEISNQRYAVYFNGSMPFPHSFTASVVNGTITSYNLPQDDDGSFYDVYYVEVTWDPGVTAGSIRVENSYNGIGTTLNLTFTFPDPNYRYCNHINPWKQNLHYGETPQNLLVTNCFSGNMSFDFIDQQWQVGDVPIGIFPQVPITWNDALSVTGMDPATFMPSVYYVDCIKAYRLKTTLIYQGTTYIYYSPIAVISTFDYLLPGAISANTPFFNNGFPSIAQTPATGGLCDGFNYVYTWERSLDNTNWSTIGTGDDYPASVQITGSCYIRRKVVCNGESLYSNVLNIIVPTLNPGTITGGTIVPFNTQPSITQTPASGGVCNAADYIYTWESSVNNGAWLTIGYSITFPSNYNIIGNCKIRRKVHCFYEDAYTAEISFTILPYVSINAENLNYVRTNDIVIPGVQSWEQADGALQTGDKLQTTTYLDNFGRPIQSVTKQGSFIPTSTGANAVNLLSNYQDLVSYTAYDGLGRTDKAFLPYATTTNLGFFKTNAATEQQSFNNQKYGEPVGNVYTYSQTTYDGSPLNRVTNTKLAGAALNNDLNYKGISSDYDFNKQTDNIHIWDIGFNSGDKPYNSGVYADNLLAKSIAKDEKDKLIVTYTDFSGHTVLKRVQEAATVVDNDYTGWLNTYYVYDDFGQLRYTITPKAVAAMATSGSWIIDDDTKKGLCFYQEYDNRGRVIVKHSPDGGEVWLVYDNRDRLVLSQDENQRNRVNLTPAKLNQWSFSLYDDNDRVLSTGLVNESRDRSNMQTYVDGLIAQNQQVQIYTGTNETITAYNPVTASLSGNIFINSVNYYDDYTHKPANHNVANLTASDFATITNNAYVEPPNVSFSRIRGASTVSKIRVLDANYDDDNSANDKFLATTTYYDDKGRAVQSYADNYIGNATNGIDASAILYDFAGKVVCTRGKHNLPNNDFDGLYVITKNDYDLLGRPSTLWKLYTKNTGDIGNDSKYKKLSEIKLDEFGRGKTKTIGDDPQNAGTALETMDYSYNIQGQLTGVNKDYALANTSGNMNDQWTRRFGFYLGYENDDNSFANKQYNGSITGVIWRSQGDNIQRKYDYDYDNINRFKSATFLQKDAGIRGAWGTAQVDISASVSGYDANGNIQGMMQKGIVPGTNGGIILDDMLYHYYDKSNKLKEVADVNNAYTGKQGDFKDYDDATNHKDYDYDFNGNLKYDKNKNIVDANSNQTDVNPNAGIVSNFLDLPQTITIKGKSITEYTYAAAGNKLAKKVTQLTASPPPPVTTWYIGGFVYEETSAGNNLQYILNEEGKLRITDITPMSTPQGVVTGAITGNVDFGLPTKQGVWDYYLKDNLSNTRMVLTEEGQMQIMTCKMEGNAPGVTPTALQAEEEANFQSTTVTELANTRTLPNTPVPGWTSNTTQVSKLQPLSGAGAAIGPNVILKVMAGDIISAKADYYYQANTPDPQTNVLTAIANSLLGSLGGSTAVASGVKSGADINYLTNTVNGPLQPFLNQYQLPVAGNKPRAYLNYIFFDEQFRYVGESSGAKMVENAGDGQSFASNPVVTKAPKNGYVYVYLSNETPNMPVYFDNFIVSHIRGPIVEDNAYYPFGLKIQGISAKAAGKLNTKQGYQGDYSERDEETGYDEFALRFYDPQIGRWAQVDPFDVEPGMYNGMSNDPINKIDKNGGTPTPDWYQNECGSTIWLDETADKVTYLGEDYKNIGNGRWENPDEITTRGVWGEIKGHEIWEPGGKTSSFRTNEQISMYGTGDFPEPAIAKEISNSPNAAQKWDNFNNSFLAKETPVGTISSTLYSLANSIWTFSSSVKNGWRNARDIKGDHLLLTYGAKEAETMRFTATMTVLTLPFSELGGPELIEAKQQIYIPKSSLPFENIAGVDIPIADAEAMGFPHTRLGGKISEETGVLYRQSATFGDSWPPLPGTGSKIVPYSRVDWYDHGRPFDHTIPHQHPFYWNGTQWMDEKGPGIPFF